MSKCIDLGLPSGTLWARQNEEGHHTFDEAKEKFGNNLPTIEMWDELRNECEWKWNSKKKGYDVVGKNGNSIFLPAAGYLDDTSFGDVGTYGNYWSSSLNVDYPDNSWVVSFSSSGVSRDDLRRFYELSVRLIKNGNKPKEEKKDSSISQEQFDKQIEHFKQRYKDNKELPYYVKECINGAIAFTMRMCTSYPELAKNYYDRLPKITMD